MEFRPQWLSSKTFWLIADGQTDEDTAMARDTVFQMTGSHVRFGVGATREVGMDFADLGARRVLLVIDPAVLDLYPGQSAMESLKAADVDFEVFDPR